MRRMIYLLLVVCLMGCGEKVEESKIRVFVDSSLESAINDVINQYIAENPVNIEVISDSTNTLFNKIEDGSHCDIFIPSSKEQVNSLIKDEYLKEENVTPILTNNMVLIAGYKYGGNYDIKVKSFDTVTEAKSLAIAEEGDPAGLFAREIFINLNVFKSVLSMKNSTYKDSPSVASAVAEGKNEVGVCYETDALANADKVQIITLAPKDSLNSEILYSVAIMETDDGLEPAQSVKEFAEYLDTPEAADIFADYDFGIYMN